MDGFSLKEVVIDLKNELSTVKEGNELALKTQAQILGTLQNIDSHLAKLNSKVASHEGKISDLSSEHTRFKAIVSTLGAIAGIVWAGVTFIFK